MYLVVVLVSVLVLANFEKTTTSSKNEIAAASTSIIGTMSTTEKTKSSNHNRVLIVFSDVDGTLVHYPEKSITTRTSNEEEGDNKILRLPPSATGMQGIISYQTLIKCQEIRNRGVKLVLVSGMRTSTLLKRLPFLPQADAYCSEAGGRIFYRKQKATTDTTNTKFTYKVTPKAYFDNDGVVIKTEPFEIVEDLQWRERMQDKEAAGTDGYIGAELLDLQQQQQQSTTTTTTTATTTPVPIEDRDGVLWNFARQLIAKGYVLDTKGYSSCFRVNRKQQTKVSPQEFEALLRGEVLPCPPQLGTSVNLGCIDYYPVQSGKKNCCQYLASKFLQAVSPSSSPTQTGDLLLSTHCVCLCDDDNDLEMALACQHAYIPGISSESMANTIANNPNHFSQTGGAHHKEGVGQGTISTEKALTLVLERIR